LKEEEYFNLILEQKNVNYFDNIYDIKIDSIQKYKKYKEFMKKIKKPIMKKKKNFENECKYFLFDLKDDLNNEKQIIDKYTKEHELDCVIENMRYKQRYNIEIDLIQENNNSSESDSDSDLDSDLDSNYSNNNNLLYNKNEKTANIIMIKNKFADNGEKFKKISISSSWKETNDRDKEINNNNILFKNNNKYLLNKLVELKEKYNKLMIEKYELEKEKKLKEKKIYDVKYKFIKNNNFNHLKTDFNFFVYNINYNNEYKFIIKS